MDTGKAEFDKFCSAVDEDIHCQDSLKYVIGQLMALGNHIIGFWKKIMQDESPKRPQKVMHATEERVPNLSDSQTPTTMADDDRSNMYKSLSLKHMIRQLVAVGTRVKGFCSEIGQSQNPKRPQNIANVKEEEVPHLYNSRTPSAKDDNMCSFPKVKVAGPDNSVQRSSSIKQSAATGIYDNSNAGNKRKRTGETEISSLASFQFISDSSTKCETTRVDLNTEVASDQQAVDFVLSAELSESDGSGSRVDSDGVPSLASIELFSSEDEFSESDYVVL